MFVYVIENKVNGKKYVGATIKSAERRFSEHVRSAENGMTCSLHRSIRKHGADKFIVEVLEECSSVEAMFERERFWIAELRTHVSFGSGYNMTIGGEGRAGYEYTDEARMNISVARRKFLSDPVNYESFMNSQRNKDKSYCNDPLYKEKIRNVHLGRKRPPGTGKKISEALKSKNLKRTDDQKKSISRKLKGNRCARRCVIVQLLNDDVVGVHETTYAAARAVGKIAPGRIINCCKHRQQSAHGFVWCYYEEYMLEINHMDDNARIED